MASTHKEKHPKQYIILSRRHFESWKCCHIALGINGDEANVMLLQFRLRHPFSEVRLYLCETNTVPKHHKSNDERKPRWITHPAKKMQSTAWLLEDNEATAVCNVCGAVGPTITKDENGNAKLREEGWFKEESIPPFGASFFFRSRPPEFILRCPSCEEQVTSENTRKDWF